MRCQGVAREEISASKKEVQLDSTYSAGRKGRLRLTRSCQSPKKEGLIRGCEAGSAGRGTYSRCGNVWKRELWNIWRWDYEDYTVLSVF